MASHPPNPMQTPRLASPTLVPQLERLINTAFRSEPTGQIWRHEEQERRVDVVSAPFISALINDPGYVMLVGMSTAGPDTAISCCCLRKPSEPTQTSATTRTAWLGLLAVSPEHQKSGHGFEMLEYAEFFVTNTWQAQRLELDTMSTRVELNAWYERCGYSECGTRKPFQHGRIGHEIFVQGLEVVVLGKDLARPKYSGNTST